MPRFRYIPSALTTRVLNIPLRIAARGLLDFEVSGLHHIPKDGPLVVASNHFSHLDPPLVVNALGRLVRFIAVDELFGNHLTFDVVTKYFGAIPTDRDGVPLRALEEALLEFPGSAMVISHDRWFLDRIATHILAFEGNSEVVWFAGNYADYEEDRKRRLGADAANPHRIKYKRLDA